MFLPDSAPSSSSSGLNGEADDYRRVADILEKRLATTLRLDVREAIRSAFTAEAAKWSSHLASSLHQIEHEFVNQLKMRLPPFVAADGSMDGAGMASSTSHYVSSVRKEWKDPPFATHGVNTDPSSVISDESDDEGGTAKCSSIASRTPPLYRANAPNTSARRPRARFNCEPTVEDIASLEQRLANDIFKAKLGKSLNESIEDSLSGGSDHRMEPGLGTTLGKTLSVPPSASPSFETSENPASRSSSLKATRSSSFGAARSATRIDVEMTAGMTMSKSSSLLLSMESLQSKQWSLATGRFYQGETPVELSSTPIRLFVKCLPRLLGTLPWNPRYKRCSTLYQVLVVLLSFCATLTISSQRSNGFLEVGNRDVVVTFFGIVLAFGSFLGLCACLVHNKKIVAATILVERYAGRADMRYSWDKRSLKDTCCVLLVFALCIGLECLPGWFGGRAEFDCAIVFVELILLVLCSQILRFVRFLCIGMEVYCNYVIESQDFADAVQEWYLLHATCRIVCESIQLCFVFLQSVAVGALLLVCMTPDIRLIHETLLLPHILSGVLCAIMISILTAYASSLTHKCDRVPILINAASIANMDSNRMYLVEYILRSKTGFYIFNLKLSSGIVLKTFYAACVVAFSLTSHAFLASP